MAYEKDGYTWMEEPLSELIKPTRLRQIRLDAIRKQRKTTATASPFLLDTLDDKKGIGCALCFI